MNAMESDGPCVKRRRLSGKVARPEWCQAQTQVTVLVDSGEVWRDPHPPAEVGSVVLPQVLGPMLENASPSAPEGRSPSYKAFHNAYHGWYNRRLRGKMGSELDELRRRYDLNKQNSNKKRLVLVREWAADGATGTAALRAWALQHFADKHDIDGQRAPWIDAKTVLLTFQGPWGVIPMTDVPSDVAAVEQHLRMLPEVLELWAELEAAAQGWHEAFGCYSHACSLEVCTETFKRSGEVRLHGHVFLRASRLRLSKAQVMFKGSCPHKGDDCFGSRSSRAGSNAGMYYLHAPKYGQLFSGGSLQPFRDYPVQGAWVLSLLQSEKIGFAEARREIVRSAKDLPRLLANLDRWRQETGRMALEVQMRSTNQLLAATRKPFVKLPQVTAWLEHYSVLRDRYCFLVLDGPSQMGKTRFSMSLVPEGCALELNMASAPQPDLRSFDSSVHTLILFDEAEPKQILAQKKLFQAPACLVKLGCSPTNCDAYDVYLHRRMLVVSANDWLAKLSRLPPADRGWLEANSFFVAVESPLFVA
jgi:hypothetical protein